MKTTIQRTMLLLTAMFIITASQAAGPAHKAGASHTDRLERALDRALDRHLSFPYAAKGDMTGEVYVSFVIDKEGHIQVLDCRAENDRLKDHVLRKLARIDIGDNPEGVWRTTHMRIRFAPEAPRT